MFLTTMIYEIKWHICILYLNSQYNQLHLLRDNIYYYLNSSCIYYNMGHLLNPTQINTLNNFFHKDNTNLKIMNIFLCISYIWSLKHIHILYILMDIININVLGDLKSLNWNMLCKFNNLSMFHSLNHILNINHLYKKIKINIWYLL